MFARFVEVVCFSITTTIVMAVTCTWSYVHNGQSLFSGRNEWTRKMDGHSHLRGRNLYRGS